MRWPGRRPMSGSRISGRAACDELAMRLPKYMAPRSLPKSRPLPAVPTKSTAMSGRAKFWNG